MDIVIALLAGFIGGLLAVASVALIVLRRLKKNPMFQMAKGMGSGPAFPPGMFPGA